MKNLALSIEQMKHLQELGLDTSDASMCYKLNLWGNDGTLCMGSVPKINDVDKPLYIPAYILGDILDILPDGFGANTLMCNKEKVCYIDCTFHEKVCFYCADAGSIIDAAYQMLCWCIENGFVETNKK